MLILDFTENILEENGDFRHCLSIFSLGCLRLSLKINNFVNLFL